MRKNSWPHHIILHEFDLEKLERVAARSVITSLTLMTSAMRPPLNMYRHIHRLFPKLRHVQLTEAPSSCSTFVATHFVNTCIDIERVTFLGEGRWDLTLHKNTLIQRNKENFKMISTNRIQIDADGAGLTNVEYISHVDDVEIALCDEEDPLSTTLNVLSKALPTLHTLSIRAYNDDSLLCLTNSCICQHFSAFSNLTHLQIVANSSPFSDEKLAELAQVSSLKELSLNGATMCTGTGLREWKLSNLQKINLVQCKSWNEHGFQALIELPKLTHVTIQNMFEEIVFKCVWKRSHPLIGFEYHGNNGTRRLPSCYNRVAIYNKMAIYNKIRALQGQIQIVGHEVFQLARPTKPPITPWTIYWSPDGCVTLDSDDVVQEFMNQLKALHNLQKFHKNTSVIVDLIFAQQLRSIPQLNELNVLKQFEGLKVKSFSAPWSALLIDWVVFITQHPEIERLSCHIAPNSLEHLNLLLDLFSSTQKTTQKLKLSTLHLRWHDMLLPQHILSLFTLCINKLVIEFQQFKIDWVGLHKLLDNMIEKETVQFGCNHIYLTSRANPLRDYQCLLSTLLRRGGVQCVFEPWPYET
jgi:hypothetical protein